MHLGSLNICDCSLDYYKSVEIGLRNARYNGKLEIKYLNLSPTPGRGFPFPPRFSLSLFLSLSPVWRTEITCVYEAIVATISVDLNSPSTRLFLGSYNLLHSHRNLIPAPPLDSNCFAGYDIKSKCCQVSGYQLSFTIRLSKIAFVVRIIRQMDLVTITRKLRIFRD